jgi:hypothetical protein
MSRNFFDFVIADSTGQVLRDRFFASETSLGYLLLLRQMLEQGRDPGVDLPGSSFGASPQRFPLVPGGGIGWAPEPDPGGAGTGGPGDPSPVCCWRRSGGTEKRLIGSSGEGVRARGARGRSCNRNREASKGESPGQNAGESWAQY